MLLTPLSSDDNDTTFLLKLNLLGTVIGVGATGLGLTHVAALSWTAGLVEATGEETAKATSTISGC